MNTKARHRRPPLDIAGRRVAPDFTTGECIAARRRIASMLVAGLPLPTVTALFGLRESEFQFDPRGEDSA